jgi:hypothetical protein
MIRRLYPLALIVAACSTFATTTRAEPIAPLVHETSAGAVGDRAAYAGAGLDGALVAMVGGAFGIAAAGPRLRLAALGELTWVAGNLDLDDFRVRAAVRADALRARAFRLRVELAPLLRFTSTEMFQAEAFGTELRIAPGFDVGPWSVELDAALEQEWFAYIAPTDRYRREVYAGAVTGYYGMTARTLRVGASGAARIGAFEVSVEGGWEQTASLDFLPAAYATLGLAARF